MLKYILFFPRGRNHVFLLNTRAGMKIGSWNTPGLSGLALLLPMLILMLKGYRIIGVLPLDMPSNWISLHPGLFPSAVDFIVLKCHAKVNCFSSEILSGQRFMPWYFLAFLPLDLAVSPISVLYLFIGRFFLAKTFFASKKCNGCGICKDYCPVGAIRIIDDRPYWSFYCESCMRCINMCPQQAIETSHSMAALMIAVATSLPISYYLSVLVNKTGLTLSHSAMHIAGLVLNWLLTLTIIYFIYILMFALLHHPLVNRFFVYTSLTYYWARYKAPGISLKDFKRIKPPV
jgi:Pyruvate/2-oxoacid:ferredoxin oxidoreductase delta subunit